MLTNNKKMTVKNYEIPSNVKLSKNDDVNEFMNAFLYHNKDFFQECIDNNIKDVSSSTHEVGIYYEKGPWKWGSEGMQNQMLRRGHIHVLRSDRSTSCLNATPKLLQRILNNIYRTIENFNCISEGRYDDRKLNPCR